LTAKQIAAVTKIMSDQHLNIDAKRLTSRFYFVKEEYPRSCVQLSVSGRMENKALLTASFMEISRTLMWIFLFKKTICLEETDVWFVLIWTLPDSNRKLLMN
jgi:hypothetical protein